MKICPKCRTENADTAKFCNECGTELEIEEAELVETEAIPETKLESAEPEEKVIPSPITEVTKDNQNLVDSQAEKNQESVESTAASHPEEKKTVKLKKWQKVLIAIVAVIAILIFRPRITHVKIGYRGETTEGTVLDSNNPGFYAIGTTNYGKEKEISYTELKIKEPKTLKADGSETVTVYYKYAHTDLTIDCSTTRLKSISADYNGSEYEGTIIDKNSDIKVIATYGSGQTQELESFGVDPETTTLENGVTSNIKVYVRTDTGELFTDELSITGKEKPFTNPEIEGDHYNCTPEQFKKYTNTHSNLTLKETTSKYFDGDDYTSYIATSTSSSIEPTGLALKTNEDGKVCSMIVIASDGTTGIAESLNFASVFDKSIDLDDRSKMADLILYKVYNTDNTVIVMDNNTVEDGYLFYIMTKEYFDNNFKQ